MTQQMTQPVQSKKLVHWQIFAWVLGIHLLALGAFFTFTWPAFFLFLFLTWLTGGIGVCLGYHRLLTHHSFQAPRWVTYLLSFCGILATQGGPITWVATHRYHHVHSDQEDDPHSPKEGFWWSHMSWLFASQPASELPENITRLAPDLCQDPGLRWLNRYHGFLAIAFGVLLFVWGGWPFLVWGLGVRTAFVYHSTWLVNSATHKWGYRTFKTTDNSRNNWWVALLAFGEGWHNNHHAYQQSARHGMRWWEVDLTYMTIRLMEIVGLAWKVQRPRVSSTSR